MTPLTICYFGAYRPHYPRNNFYRGALQQLGVRVIECRADPRARTLVKAWQLLAQFRRAPRADVLLVAEFNHTLVPLAWALARLRRMTLVFDPGLSLYDENIRHISPRSLRALYLRLADTLAFRLPDLVLWFTPVDEEYFRDLFRIPAERSGWLPPGVAASIFGPSPLPAWAPPLTVHWDGNMSPTHGVDVIIRAAKLLEPDPRFRFEIIGTALPDIVALAEGLRLPNTRLFGSVTAGELRASMQRAHICLGVFRDDDKLRRSLYTKEMQAMNAGRPLVTAYGEAKDRLFRNGHDLIMIPPESPEALADSLRALADDPARAARIAANAAAALAALCAPENAGKKLLALIERTRKA